MFFCDFHTHSTYSFDGPHDELGSVRALCEEAVKRGITELAITDHYDVNGIVEGIYDPYDAEAARRDIMRAKEDFAPRLKLVYGIELGEATQYPKEARQFLDKYKFEFVIGSLHNLRGVPDFSFLKYEHMSAKQIDMIFDRALDETLEMLDFDGISALGHLTYMHRYVAFASRKLDFSAHTEKIRLIYKKLIEKGIALEVNTSLYRKGLDFTMPALELICLYRECGGEYITVGSDAHGSADIGGGIENGVRLIKDAGFGYITTYVGGKPVQHKI